MSALLLSRGKKVIHMLVLARKPKNRSIRIPSLRINTQQLRPSSVSKHHHRTRHLQLNPAYLTHYHFPILHHPKPTKPTKWSASPTSSSPSWPPPSLAPPPSPSPAAFPTTSAAGSSPTATLATLTPSCKPPPAAPTAATSTMPSTAATRKPVPSRISSGAAVLASARRALCPMITARLRFAPCLSEVGGAHGREWGVFGEGEGGVGEAGRVVTSPSVLGMFSFL